MGAGGAMGVGGKTGTGGAMMGVGGAMMGTGGAPGFGLGSACSVGTQCASGLCVDKVCCNVACAGQCQACDIAPSRGTCSPVASGPPHGSRAACGGSRTTCGGPVQAHHADRRRLRVRGFDERQLRSADLHRQHADAGASAATGSARARRPRPAPVRSGLSCNAAQTACLAVCTTNADCTCRGAELQSRPRTSARLRARSERRAVSPPIARTGCASTASAATLHATGRARPAMSRAMEGQCTPLNAGQPHGQRGACGSPSNPCGGRCSGSSAMECTFPSGNTCACAPPVSTPGTCNGAGSCLLLGLSASDVIAEAGRAVLQ